MSNGHSSGSANIRFCEPSYVHSHLIAEWWNAWSALSYSAVGIVFLVEFYGVVRAHSAVFPLRVAVRYVICASCFIVMGFGSALFHATQSFWAELLDEIPMVLCVLSIVWCQIDTHPLVTGRKRHRFFAFLVPPVAAATAAYVWLRYHPLFTLVFTLLTLVPVWLVLTSPVGRYVSGNLVDFSSVPAAVWSLFRGVTFGYSRSLLVLAGVLLGVARLIWQVDQVCVDFGWADGPEYCSLAEGFENPPAEKMYYESLWFLWAHTAWHVISAMGVYCSLHGLVKVRRELYKDGPVRRSPRILARRNLSSNYMLQMLWGHAD